MEWLCTGLRLTACKGGETGKGVVEFALGSDTQQSNSAATMDVVNFLGAVVPAQMQGSPVSQWGVVFEDTSPLMLVSLAGARLIFNFDFSAHTCVISVKFVTAYAWDQESGEVGATMDYSVAERTVFQLDPQVYYVTSDL